MSRSRRCATFPWGLSRRRCAALSTSCGSFWLERRKNSGFFTMITCETCQAQLLHHLYGLLEDGDRLAMAAHLGTCASCQASLEMARGQQSMLAVAAKSEFPDVRFAPVPQSAQLAPTIEYREKKRSQAWLRWAVAACILVLLGGAGTFAGIAWNGYRSEVNRARD